LAHPAQCIPSIGNDNFLDIYKILVKDIPYFLVTGLHTRTIFNDCN